MYIPRNPNQETPSREAILASGLLTDRASVISAYRGSEPLRHVQHLPQGVLMILAEGFAFLATTEPGIPIRALVQYLSNHMTNHVATAVLPFGGVLTALLNGSLDEDLSASLERCLNHPDTFVVPYVEIVETVYFPVGKFGIGRRDYTIVTRESAHGERESLAITPADTEMADALLMLRFAAEKRAIRVKLLREQTDFRGIQSAVLQKYRLQFPSTLGQHKQEMAVEIMERAAAQLTARGSSLERLDAMVLDELSYFRTVPQFTKYFALAS